LTSLQGILIKRIYLLQFAEEKIHVPTPPVAPAPEVPLSTELHLSPEKYEPVTVAEVVEYRLSRYIEHPMAELDKVICRFFFGDFQS